MGVQSDLQFYVWHCVVNIYWEGIYMWFRNHKSHMAGRSPLLAPGNINRCLLYGFSIFLMLETLFFIFLFFIFILFIYDSHRERERGRDTGRGRSRVHAPGARRGIRSRVFRIGPWAKGRCQTAAPPRDPIKWHINVLYTLSCNYRVQLFLKLFHEASITLMPNLAKGIIYEEKYKYPLHAFT